MTVAGKTGTTEDYNDLWFVGYTPYYTCAVWSGYDNNEKIPEDARNFHKNLWKKVMTRIHEGLEDRDFDMPSSVEKASVCAETGLLPRSGCPTITEYFDISSLPTEYCDQHFYGSSDYDEEDYYYNEDTDADTDAAAEAIPSAAPTVLTASTLTILTIPMTVPIIPVMILTIPEQTTTPVVMTAAMITAMIPVAMTPAKIR